MTKMVVLLASVVLAMGVASGVALVEAVGPADAAFPGKNGKIAFVRNGNIHTIEPNGLGKTKLTNTPESYEYSPNFSADGTKIVYGRNKASCSSPCSTSAIYTMRADGSHQVRLLKTKRGVSAPAWSPNGQRIVFAMGPAAASTREDTDLYTINRDGSDLKRLTNTPGRDERSPAWSPDGSTIAFVIGGPIIGGSIFLMEADGSAEEVLVAGDDFNYYYSPDWSPDGQWIAFTWAGELGEDSSIAVVRKDGTDLKHLREYAEDPAFSPDGKKILFNSSWGGWDVCRPPNLYSMKVDGSESTLLVRYPYSDCDYSGNWPSPSWQPLP